MVTRCRRQSREVAHQCSAITSEDNCMLGASFAVEQHEAVIAQHNKHRSNTSTPRLRRKLSHDRRQKPDPTLDGQTTGDAWEEGT